MSERKLSLQEQLLLLCLNDGTGKFEQANLGYGLNAAGLAELLLAERLSLEGDKVKVQDTKPVGDEVLDLALTRVATSKRTYQVGWWVRCLYRRGTTPLDVLLARLIQRGILTEEEGRILWVFPRPLYPTVDRVPEQQLRQEVRDVILGGNSPDDRLVVLIALLHACGALRLLLSKTEMKQQKKRIQSLFEANPIGHAVAKAVAEAVAADAATAAICTTMVITTSALSSS